jgi:hypothetical protein
VRRVDLGGEWAGVEASGRREHRETAHAAAPEAVEVGLAVAVERALRPGTGVEEDLVALEQPAGVGGCPGFEALARVRRQGLGVAAVQDRVVQDRLAARIAVEDGEQAVGDAVREDREQAAEAVRATATPSRR